MHRSPLSMVTAACCLAHSRFRFVTGNAIGGAKDEHKSEAGAGSGDAGPDESEEVATSAEGSDATAKKGKAAKGKAKSKGTKRKQAGNSCGTVVEFTPAQLLKKTRPATWDSYVRGVIANYGALGHKARTQPVFVSR